MRAATAAGAIACLLAALSGCGSSHGAGSGTTGTTSSGSGTTAGTERSTSPGGIRIDTTPKFIAPPAGSPVHSGLVQVSMRNISLSPDAFRVKAGSTIRWSNYDNVLHNVTSV